MTGWNCWKNSPEYQNKCYCYHWSEDHLKILLKKIPEFDLNLLDSYSWGFILCCISPEFADRCKWETFTGHDWSYILQKQPQFADKCNWAKLNRKDWFDFNRAATAIWRTVPHFLFFNP